MGGTGVFVPVRVRSDRLGAGPVKRSLLDKVLGRTPTSGLTKVRNGSEIVYELHGIDADPVEQAFIHALEKRFPEPWAATRALISYLDSGVMDVKLRGYERDGNPEPTWRAEVLFSSRGGQTRVAAMAAAHWFSMWCRRGRDGAVFCESAITFDAHGPMNVYDELFVPLGRFGYGRLMTAECAAIEDEDEDTPWSWCQSVEIDPSMEEAMTIAHLDHHAVRDAIESLPYGVCLCQWCSPKFDTSSVEWLFGK